MSWIEAMNLPPATVVQQQLKLADFLRATTPAKADEKLLREAIEQLTIQASIKTANANILPLTTDLYHVVEVLVMTALVKPAYVKNHVRVGRLLNAIPHPVVLWLTDGRDHKLVLQEKRVNQSDASRRTGGTLLASPILPETPVTEAELLFRALLDFQQQDRFDLKALYDSYLQALLALLLQPVVGTVAKRPTLTLQQDLDTWNQLQNLQTQRRQEAKERFYSAREQLAQNLRIKSLDQEINQLTSQLKDNMCS